MFYQIDVSHHMIHLIKFLWDWVWMNITKLVSIDFTANEMSDEYNKVSLNCIIICLIVKNRVVLQYV